MAATPNSTTYPAPQPHGRIEELVPNVHFVRGSIRMGPGMTISRNMAILHHEGELTIINSVRLHPGEEEHLLRLGTVKRVVRIGYFHGVDDPYYVDTYGAEFWSLPGSDNFEGPAVDVEFDADTPLPGGRFFVFERTKKPEAAVFVDQGGGVLLTCDSVQHWPDLTGCSIFARGVMALMGFKHPANIGPPWRKTMTPVGGTLRPDFERLLELPFDSLLGAHGAPLFGGAREALRATVDRVFEH